MRQFDVVENGNPATSYQVPYLLVLQADLFDDLTTRVVAPLFPAERFGQRLDWLSPSVFIDGNEFVVSMTELAGVPTSIIGERVCSADSHRGAVVSALDFLFTGS